MAKSNPTPDSKWNQKVASNVEVWYDFRGEKLSLYRIGIKVGTSSSTLHKRMQRGMSLEEAIAASVKSPKAKPVRKPTDLSAERLRQLLRYDPETGIFLWKVRRGPKTPAGSVAGNTNPEGYRQICVDNCGHRAHRLAWLYVHGRWPDGVIDHINRVRDDNRLANLREVSPYENTQNTTPKLGRTAPKGVYWNTAVNKWVASIRHNTKHYHLGVFDNTDDAHAAYLKARAELRRPDGVVSAAAPEEWRGPATEYWRAMKALGEDV